MAARARGAKPVGDPLVGLIASPDKDAAVAGDSGTAVGASVNRKNALSVKARYDSRSPSDDLFGGADAELTALVATPRVPAAVSIYSIMDQSWAKSTYRVLPRPSSLSVRRAREWESPQEASSTLPEQAHQISGYYRTKGIDVTHQVTKASTDRPVAEWTLQSRAAVEAHMRDVQSANALSEPKNLA